uniref:SUEL-type lectin domain-containing protein n=1 Tax=Anguilla anguilla TaxID=7936 RepID=A0A0E9Q5P6_ANGAN
MCWTLFLSQVSLSGPCFGGSAELQTDISCRQVHSYILSSTIPCLDGKSFTRQVAC